MKMVCDYLIVGGGSAGCVMASRLSADPSASVILVEAGRDMPPGQEEPAILDSYPRIAYFNPINVWGDLRVRLVADGNGPATPPRRYEQAKLIGGGSSLNDMQAPRGLPGDYDEWDRLGAKGWDWNGVLPFFRRLERDINFSGPLHGKDGPLPIRRIEANRWPAYSSAAAAAFRECGFTELDDQNGSFTDGFFPVAITNENDKRVSTAIAYLTETVRSRSNLRIIPYALVRSLSLKDERVTGAQALTQSGPLDIEAGETILCAGALHSPAILLRSGIGPGRDLVKLGINVIADRKGVGENLMEHPGLSISAWISPEARLQKDLRRHIHVALRYSSGMQDVPQNDMFMVAVSRTGWHPVGHAIGSLLTYVNKSYSTGTVKLANPNPDAEPDVRFNMLSDFRDLERLKNGLRLAAELYARRPLAEITDVPFPTSYSERIRDLGKPSAKTFLLTWILTKGLDSGQRLRRLLIDKVVTDGAPLSRLLKTDDVLDSFVREQVHGLWHPSCTCKMGSPEDPMAVTDPAGRVIGVRDLRVADASSMPMVPRANTNITTIMIAEKISDQIMRERAREGCRAFVLSQ